MFNKCHLIQLDLLMRNGKEKNKGAIELIDALVAEDIPFLILSEQTGRKRESIVEYLNQIGFQGIQKHHIYSSAMASVDWILQNHPQKNKVAYLGGVGIKEALEIGQLELNHHYPDWFFIGMNRNATYQDYCFALQSIEAGAQLISTDERQLQIREGAPMIGNASVVKMLEYASGKQALHFGRGTEKLISMALNYKELKNDQAIYIGDRYKEDIGCANQMNIESLYVTYGNTLEHIQKYDSIHPTYIVEDLFGLTK